MSEKHCYELLLVYRSFSRKGEKRKTFQAPVPSSDLFLPSSLRSNCRMVPIWLLIKTQCHVLFSHFPPSLLWHRIAKKLAWLPLANAVKLADVFFFFFPRGCYARRGPLTSAEALWYFPFTSASGWPLPRSACDWDPTEAKAFSLERHLMKM